MRLIRMVLATWRISDILTGERGPYAVFERLRVRFPLLTPVIMGEAGPREFLVGIDDIEEATWLEPPPGPAKEAGELLHCPYCLSPWIAALVLLFESNPRTRPYVDLAAVAGGVAVILDALGAIHTAVGDYRAGGSESEAGDLRHGTSTD